MSGTDYKRRLNRKRRKRHVLPGEEGAMDAGRELFDAGYELDLEGHSGKAEVSYRQTIEILEALSDESGSGLSMNDLAQLAFEHGEKMFELGRYESAKNAFQRATEVLDSLVVLDASFTVIVKLAETLSLLARCQRKSGRGMESCRTYERCTSLWRTLLMFPQSIDDHDQMSHRLATALFGYSKVLAAHGQKQKARRHAEEAKEILQRYFPEG